MRLRITTSAIEVYAEALVSEGATEAGARLQQLLKATQGFTSKPMAEFVAVLGKIEVASAAVDSDPSPFTVADAVRSLKGFEILLRKVSTQSRIDDFVLLVAQLERHESASLKDLLEAVKVQRRGRRDGEAMDARQLATKLKDALGDDTRFDPLFEQLSGLSAAVVAQVTDSLMSSGSSGSRKKDLSRIRDRHAALRTLNAKERAMSGKSAA